ncbi:uncharacterized protein LOC110452340 [Mizuhopecten yessoensis]|uniref:GAR domain-containing protein n=1 Tax=Mizuhopecten yessoensis TaxID=6573 RepID=A0A210QJR8_MIZYE|nr:uncharacterized protein LOC110452340 [Mizuhopecten yessoensis]OWF48990.1 hypothetical protein KP79_PYT06973 [Mizuhopecten yessoensis]
MKLCEELKQWKLFLPNQPLMLPFAPSMPRRKSRSRPRRKRKPPDPPEKVTITVNDTGGRTVAVERVVPKREKQVLRRLSREEAGENEAANSRSQNISTQTTLQDLEFLITDPRIQETRGPRRAWLPEEVVYTRQTTAHRTYHTGDTTLNVEHRSTDNIVVQIDKHGSARVDNEKGQEDKENGRRENEHGQRVEGGDTRDKEETNRKFTNNGKRITFSDETDKTMAQTDKEKTDGTTSVRAPSKVAKACGHKLPMVRVGGGWMEVPDYLRSHVPMHVHVENTKDGQEGNLIIRSQRPRSQMFSKKGESPSWTATLSRGTKGSASTTMRQRLV